MGFRLELGGRRKLGKRAVKFNFPTGLLCQDGRVICHKIKFRPPRKENFMIDAREEVSVPASHKGSRRSASVAAGRHVKASVGAAKKSARVERVFSDPKVKPFDQIEWERRTAEITDDAGKVIFKQENVEVPKSWSLLATKVVVSKYFYGEQQHGRARNLGAPAHSSHFPDDCGLGRGGRLFQQGGRRDFLRGTDLAVPESIRRVQLAGLVQRRAVP